MATDQTAVALDITSRTVDLVTRLINTIDEIEEEVKHGDEANINFNNFDDDFAASDELKHIDGSLINKLRNDVFGPTGLRNFLATTNSGAKSYERILYEISR